MESLKTIIDLIFPIVTIFLIVTMRFKYCDILRWLVLGIAVPKALHGKGYFNFIKSISNKYAIGNRTIRTNACIENQKWIKVQFACISNTRKGLDIFYLIKIPGYFSTEIIYDKWRLHKWRYSLP